MRVIVFDSAVPDYFCAHFDMISGFDVSKAPENIPVGKDWPAVNSPGRSKHRIHQWTSSRSRERICSGLRYPIR